jgi:hypothetical protein
VLDTEPSQEAPAATQTDKAAVARSVEASRLRRSLRWSGAFVRQHWLFALLLAAGVGLRVVTFLAYPPALLSPDSVNYLMRAELLADGRPSTVKPAGYTAFLLLFPFDHLAVIPAVQHLFGVAVAALLYAVLVHLGVRTWLAALGTAPVLLDAYQLNIEQHILSEALFELLIVAAFALLLWRPRATPPAAVAGVLLAAATLTRVAGGLVVLPALLTIVFLRGGWVRAVSLLGCFALPIVAYAVWFHALYGEYALSKFEGRHLYGRVLTFVDCSRFDVPQYERVLCLDAWNGVDPPQNALVWGQSPINRIDQMPPGMTRNEVAADFAKRAIVHQPLDYARAVLSDFLRYYAPTKTSRPGELNIQRWRFERSYRVFAPSGQWSSPPAGTRPRLEQRRAESVWARFIRAYQQVGFTPGPVLAACLIVGAAAALGLGRARSSGLRSAAFLFTAAALALVFATAAFTLFSWRYQLPQLIVLPPALALGLTALTGKRAREASDAASARAPDRVAPV